MKIKNNLFLCLILIFLVFPALLLCPSASSAWIKVMEPGGFPARLVLQGEDELITAGVLDRAVFWSPAGIYEIEGLAGMRLVSAHAGRLRQANAPYEDLLWKLTFLNPAKSQKEGLHIWIAMTGSRVWLSSSQAAPSLWDSMVTNLKVPKGTAVYVSSGVPSFGGLKGYSGKSVLSFVYTVRITQKGPDFVPIREVYKQLEEQQDKITAGEFDPLRRLAYERQSQEYRKLSKGYPPSAEVLNGFVMTYLYAGQWRE